jgi:broad specificity phosphatase PhoE
LQQKYANMTTLYLVRHGETVDNVNQIMQGQTQGELTDNGIRQAEEGQYGFFGLRRHHRQ